MNVARSITLPLVILGAGGHAKVLLSLLKSGGYDIQGICDPALAQNGVEEWRGVEVLGADEILESLDPTQVCLVNGVGQIAGTELRHRVYEKARAMGFRFPALVHHSAYVDESAELADGVQIMAGAVIQPDVKIGFNSLINTMTSLDHDCVIGKHVHIAPGATLCGGVAIADGVFVGSGATVVQGINIDTNAIIGAGTVVVRDVSSNCTLLGSPVRRIFR